LVIVSFNASDAINQEWLDTVIDDEYLDRTELYSDPDRILYRELGFGWSFTPKVFPIKIVKMYAGIHTTKPGTELAFKATNRIPKEEMGADADYRFRRFVNNDTMLQQGGDVVVDNGGKILKIFPMAHVNDRPSTKEVLDV